MTNTLWEYLKAIHDNKTLEYLNDGFEWKTMHHETWTIREFQRYIGNNKIRIAQSIPIPTKIAYFKTNHGVVYICIQESAKYKYYARKTEIYTEITPT